MRIAMVTRDVELNPFAHERVSRRVEKLGQRLEQEPAVRVSLSSDKSGFHAQLQLAGAGREFMASASDRSNLLRAFDDAAARVDRQISRHHKKMLRRDAGVRAFIESAMETENEAAGAH